MVVGETIPKLSRNHPRVVPLGQCGRVWKTSFCALCVALKDHPPPDSKALPILLWIGPPRKSPPRQHRRTPRFWALTDPLRATPFSVAFGVVCYRRLDVLRRMLAITQPQVAEMECQLTAVIYAFRSPRSGATYIGKHQCDPEGWPRRGTGSLPDGYRGSGVVVGHIHRRHGAAVEWRILAVVDGDKDLVNRAERRAVRLARHLWADRCVNIREGGDGFTSAEARASLKAMWADTQHRAFISATSSTAAKAQWSDPEYAAKVSAARNEAVRRPDVKARMSAAATARWSDPERATKMSAATKEATNRPEVKAKNSAAQKARLLTPEGAAALARAHSPEARAKAAATRARNKALRAMETQQ